MAVGKPIVASNIEGYASVLTHGVEGLLVPPKDTEKLAQALISLMRDKSLRQEMGTKGRLKAMEYDWKYIAQRVLDYYHKLLSQAPHKEISRTKVILV
jgi:phosphatidylinositol alpha-mannosyltransferase